jgi:hypothetical protein
MIPPEAIYQVNDISLQIHKRFSLARPILPIFLNMDVMNTI